LGHANVIDRRAWGKGQIGRQEAELLLPLEALGPERSLTRIEQALAAL